MAPAGCYFGLFLFLHIFPDEFEIEYTKMVSNIHNLLYNVGLNKGASKMFFQNQDLDQVFENLKTICDPFIKVIENIVNE